MRTKKIFFQKKILVSGLLPDAKQCDKIIPQINHIIRSAVRECFAHGLKQLCLAACVFAIFSSFPVSRMMPVKILKTTS